MQDGGSHASFRSEPLSTEACAPQLVVLWSDTAGVCSQDAGDTVSQPTVKPCFESVN